MQFLLVMRHTKREDEVNENWVTTASNPWDPPISEQGVELVEEVSRRLQCYGITKIVTSPFKRCLQTGQIACKALNLPSIAVEVDWKLSEVLTAKLLNAHVLSPPHRPINEWMWQSGMNERSVAPEQDVHGAWDPEGPEVAVVNADSAPAYPETLEEGHARYAAALQEVADRHRPHNLLVVTHGEAVRQSVTRVVPWSTVFRVDHCGYTVSWRKLDEDSEWDWKLEEENKSRGVAWTA